MHVLIVCAPKRTWQEASARMGRPTEKHWRCSRGRLYFTDTRTNCFDLFPSYSLAHFHVKTVTNQKFKELCIGNLKSSPWSELDGLQPETKIINEQLGKINSNGFLTINSQPSVNAAKSDSPAIGKKTQTCDHKAYHNVPKKKILFDLWFICHFLKTYLNPLELLS